MSIKISFTDADKQHVADNHCQIVAERLEKKIKDKNKTLEWKSNFTECQHRFYNVIGSNNAFFPEMKFTPNGKNYRAILAWVKEVQTLEFICAVKKADDYQNSDQHDILTQIETHPQKVIRQAKQSLLEKQESYV
jgi:hypothetical protein